MHSRLPLPLGCPGRQAVLRGICRVLQTPVPLCALLGTLSSLRVQSCWIPSTCQCIRTFDCLVSGLSPDVWSMPREGVLGDPTLHDCFLAWPLLPPWPASPSSTVFGLVQTLLSPTLPECRLMVPVFCVLGLPGTRRRGWKRVRWCLRYDHGTLTSFGEIPAAERQKEASDTMFQMGIEVQGCE